MSCGIGDVAGCGKDFMRAIPRLCPFLRDQLTGEVLGGVLLGLVVRVHGKHAKSTWGVATTVVQAHRQIMEVVKSVAAGSEERTGKVREPQGTEGVNERLTRVTSDIELGNQQRNIPRHPVISPNVKNVADQFGFIVQTAPLDLAGLERIVLERKESEIFETVVCFQIGDKASCP